MLYLNRKPGEAVIINHEIEVRVVEVRGRTVKLGFSFPSDASVLREEVFLTVKQANQAALAGVQALPDLLGGADRTRAADVGAGGGRQPDAEVGARGRGPGA